jgi:hypothetical protein
MMLEQPVKIWQRRRINYAIKLFIFAADIFPIYALFELEIIKCCFRQAYFNPVRYIQYDPVCYVFVSFKITVSNRVVLS